MDQVTVKSGTIVIVTEPKHWAAGHTAIVVRNVTRSSVQIIFRSREGQAIVRLDQIKVLKGTKKCQDQ